jgi:hypothetical protein
MHLSAPAVLVAFSLCRIVLESRNENACKGSSCDALAFDQRGLYAHGTLQFSDAPHQVILFGDVTPIECAAAHGHVQALKLLVQVRRKTYSILLLLSLGILGFQYSWTFIAINSAFLNTC